MNDETIDRETMWKVVRGHLKLAREAEKETDFQAAEFWRARARDWLRTVARSRKQ